MNRIDAFIDFIKLLCEAWLYCWEFLESLVDLLFGDRDLLEDRRLA
jgi:hypothetical protein